MKKTRSTVRNAPANAHMEMIGTPRITIFSPKAIATTAPKELPLEMPSVNGVANEFRRSA